MVDLEKKLDELKERTVRVIEEAAESLPPGGTSEEAKKFVGDELARSIKLKELLVLVESVEAWKWDRSEKTGAAMTEALVAVS